MFEGDSADMCAGKFPLVSMGGRAERLACADPGARTPIGASGIYIMYLFCTGNPYPYTWQSLKIRKNQQGQKRVQCSYNTNSFLSRLVLINTSLVERVYMSFSM